MFRVEIYGRVRRAVLVEGRSQRAVAQEFGLARKTVQKMLHYAVPPGYQRQQAVKRPKPSSAAGTRGQQRFDLLVLPFHVSLYGKR